MAKKKKGIVPGSTLPRSVDGESVRQQIAEKAYTLFLERGATHGNDVADWLEAERRVREEGAPESVGPVQAEGAKSATLSPFIGRASRADVERESQTG